MSEPPTCHECGYVVDPDDAVYIEPTSGRVSVQLGEPFHVGCAPEETDYTQPFAYG